MKKSIALLLVTLLSLLWLAGCGGSSSSGAEAAGGEESTAAAASEGGGGGGGEAGRPLRLRLPGTLNSTDWEPTTSPYEMKITWVQVFEGLYGIDEAEGGYYKLLAKDVATSDDGTEYTITLQDGVTFQNGDPLKASDVVFSYKRAMENPRYGYLTAKIVDVAEVDDATVKITLDSAYSPIVHTFFSVKISSEREVTEQGDKYGTQPHTAGTGPYYFDEYDVSTGASLKAYDGYWQGEPAIKDVDITVITDEAAAVIAFENGELDYLDNAPLPDWESLKEAAGEGHAELIKGNDIMFLGINNLASEQLGNQKVREAIFYAVNKHDINLAVCEGFGVETPYYMPPDYVPTQPTEGFETYEYDPEKSKALLAEAGYPDGVDVGTLLIYGASSSSNAKMAQVVQANLAEVGITIGVEMLDMSVVVPRMQEQDYDLCIYSDSGNYDFNNIRQQVHSESRGMLVIDYKNSPDFDWQRMEELVDLGASVDDVDERLEYYTELWKIVMDTATMLPCIHKPVGVVWAQDLDIGQPVPTYFHIYKFKWV